MLNNALYAFSFNSYYEIHNNSGIESKNDRINVITHDPKLMTEFLKQHSFPPECINYVYMYDKTLDEDNILKAFKFKSNYSKDEYTVYTTNEILYLISTTMTNEFALNLSFGNLIMRDDIEFIKSVKDGLNAMRFTYTMETIESDMQTIDRDRFGIRIHDNDVFPIEEELGDNVSQDITAAIPKGDTDDIMPFTIEGYAAAFADVVTDSCF